MELGRFNPTLGQGTLGVGNFQVLLPLHFADPVRRVEILDADPATGNNAGAPQLRLTYTYNSNPILGTFSEFQTMSTGHLYFNTRSNTVPKFFGFHTPTPGNTVEINSVVNSPYFPVLATNGCSGLRLKNIDATKTPLTPGTNGVDPTKVLTVDNNGDVVLVTPQGAAPTNNGISTLPSGLGGPAIQLGVNCAQIFSQPALLNQATLQTDRFVFLQNKNLIFYDAAPGSGRVGIGNLATFCGVNNTLEVAADAGSPYVAASGSSGLRFTYLKSSNSTIPNGTNGVNSSKVLTVDQNGDVVLTDAAGGILNADNGCSTNGPSLNYVHLGNSVGNTQANLLDDREVPMNGHSLIFSEAAGLILPAGINRPNTLSLGAQYDPFPNGNAKLFTLNQTERIGGVFSTFYNTLPPTVKLPQTFVDLGYTGVAGHVRNLSGAGDYMTGVYGLADNSQSTSGGALICGVRGEAAGNTNTKTAIGTAGIAISIKRDQVALI